MDNDNEIGREIVRVKELFLTETFGAQVVPPKLYSVEDEFARAKKNRNSVVTLTVLAFVVIFAAAAAVITLLIERSSQKIDFDINEFQDVNLTEILDVQKRNENALEVAIREVTDLEDARDGEIRIVSADIARRIEIVENENLTIATKNNRTADLRSEEARLSDTIRGKYDPLIAERRQEIEAIQSKIAEYDTKLIEEAKKNEEQLNNQQKIFELEKQNLTDYYDERIANLEESADAERIELTKQKEELVALLRRNHAAELQRQFRLYNPVFEGPRISGVLNRYLQVPDVDLTALTGYRQTLISEKVLTQNGFTELRINLTDFSDLLARLEVVPYQNSIPESLSRLRDLQTLIIARYEYLWNELVERIDTKNEIISEQLQELAARAGLIERYEYSVDFLARDSRENGYILDARDTANILMRVNTTLPVSDGIPAYVFREVDDYIGEIKIYEDRAELVELANPERPIEPFDIFLIQLQ